MTRPTREGKNQIDLSARHGRRVGLDVVAPTNVLARRDDPSRLVGALDRYAQMRLAEHANDAREQTLVDTEEGYRASATGQVDEERMAESKAYTSGIEKHRQEAHGLRWINTARQDLERALKEDPNLDYQEWEQAQIQAFTETAQGQSSEGLALGNRFISQFQQNMRAAHSSAQAKLQVQQATTNLADNLLAFMENGLTTPEQLNQWKATRAAESGLEDDEVDQVVGTMLLERLAGGDTNALELAKSQGFMEKAEWSNRFTKQDQQTRDRLERQALEDRRRDLGTRMKVRQDIGTMVRQGQLTVTEIERRWSKGEWLEEDALYAERALQQYEEAALRDAQRGLDEAVRLQQLDAIYRGGRDTIALAVANGTVKQKDIEAYGNQQFAAATILAASSDPDEKAQGLERMKEVIDLSQKAAIPLHQIKVELGSSDVNMPDRLASDVERYRQLTAEGRGDFIRQNLDSASYARLEYLRRRIEAGQPVMDAIEHLKSAQVPIEEARQAIRPLDLSDAAVKLSKDSGIRPGLARSLIQPLAVGFAMQGMDSVQATQAAIEEAQKSYFMMDGEPVPSAWIPKNDAGTPELTPDEFNKVWPEVKEEYLLPKLRERFGDSFVDVRLVPDRTRPGTFLLQDVNSFEFIREGNSTASISLESLKKKALSLEHAKRERDAAAAQEKAEQDFQNNSGIVEGLKRANAPASSQPQQVWPNPNQ